MMKFIHCVLLSSPAGSMWLK